MNLPKGFTIRYAVPDDHERVIAVLNDWWDGRDLTSSVPRLFLNHFCNTSFVVEKEGALTAFLIGFLSFSQPADGYIHFAGVHPQFRGLGIGSYLYRRFFDICRQQGRHTVQACTSPVNKDSVAFHKRIGFDILRGNARVDGIPVTLDYNRPGDAKVLFRITI